MIKKILIPLDGSRLSESILPEAGVLSRALQASVTLIHLVEKRAPARVHGEPHLRDEQKAEEYLKKMITRYFPDHPDADYHVHYPGISDVAQELNAHKDEIAFDLVMMCTHGRGKASRYLIGSLAQQLAGTGNRPVLIMQPAVHKAPAHFPCDSILVPLDHDPEHNAGLIMAVELAGAFKATVHLVTIVPTWLSIPQKESYSSRLLPGTSSMMLDMSVSDAVKYLENKKADMEKTGLSCTIKVLRGDTVKGITKAVFLTKAQLIVLGTHGRSGLAAMWEGSITSKVCSHCHIPQLLVPAGNPAS
jgi:nucleotide-binding universal stress UspA family protein